MLCILTTLFIWQKLNRRMHLSKVKHSKFNESGQLAMFYAASAAWGVDLIIRVSICAVDCPVSEIALRISVCRWRYEYIIIVFQPV